MVTFLANALSLVQPMATEAEVLPVARNVTSAVRLDILLAVVPRVAATEAGSVVDTAVGNRPAILVEDSATWPAIALKARSATTVSLFAFFLVYGSD